VPDFRDERLDRDDRLVVGKGDMEVTAAPARRGRPRKVHNQEQLAQVIRLYFVEKMSMRKVADVIGVSHMSVYRMLSDPSVELLI
jgi:transposase